VSTGGELRRQIGAVWRLAGSGLATLREVVVRSSQSGRLRVDLALLFRERREILADLGARVRELVDRGELALPEQLQLLLDQVKDVEARIASGAGRAYDNAPGAPRGYEPEAAGYEEDDLDYDDYGDAGAAGVADRGGSR
jgi:hypothetical protein